MPTLALTIFEKKFGMGPQYLLGPLIG